MNIEISQVLRSKRRTLALEILHDARLVVRSPFKLSDAAIEEFIQKKSGWIVRTQEKIKNRRGYAAICCGHLTEGRSAQQARDRMEKALRRKTKRTK